MAGHSKKDNIMAKTKTQLNLSQFPEDLRQLLQVTANARGVNMNTLAIEILSQALRGSLPTPNTAVITHMSNGGLVITVPPQK
jgi:plasmid stability protein